MDSHLLVALSLIAVCSSSVDVVAGTFVGTSFPEGYAERRLITVRSSFGVAERRFEPLRRSSGGEEESAGASPPPPPSSSRRTSPPVTFPFRSRDATPPPSAWNLTSPQSLLLSSSRRKNEAFLPSAVLRRRGAQRPGGGGGGGASLRIRGGGAPAERSLRRRRRSPRSHSQSFQSAWSSQPQKLQSSSVSELPQGRRTPEGHSALKHHHQETPGGYDGALSAATDPLAHAAGLSPHVANLPPLLPQKPPQVSHIHPRHTQPHLILPRSFSLFKKPLLLKKKPLQAPFLPLYFPPPPPVAPSVSSIRHPYPLTFDRSQEKNRYEEADRLAPLNALSSKVSQLEFDLNNLKKSTRAMRLKETSEEDTRNINFITNNGWTPIITKPLNHVGVTTSSSATPPPLSTVEDTDDLVSYSPNDGLRETRSHNESRKKPPARRSRLRFAKKHRTQFQPDFFVTDSSGGDNNN